MEHLKKKGQITFTVTAVITLGTIVVGGLSSYYASQATTAAAISQTRQELEQEISSDRQSISSIKTDIENIKSLQATQSQDTKEILRLLK